MRGGGIFKDNMNNKQVVSNNSSSVISGRGSDIMGEGFKPPEKQDETKARKTKYGTVKITRVEDKKKKDAGNEIDSEGNLNWDVLDKKHKNKPCVILLKKLKKGDKKKKSHKNKNEALGNLFFSKYT